MSGLVINPYTFTSAEVTTPLSCTFYESRYGASMGDVDVYVVDASGNIIGSSIYSASGDDGLTGAWAQRTTSTPDVSGTFRIAWNYRQTAAVFTGDYAVDTIEIMGSSFNFDTDNDGFLTSTTNTTDSATAFSSATGVLTQTTAQTARWNRNTGGTPSSNTGPTGAQSGTHYVYCETSSPNNVTGMNFWLFSPEISIAVSGGSVTTDGADQIHTFTSNGTLTITGTSSVSVQYLAVGGGGGGGGVQLAANVAGGGGGGGGVRAGTTSLSPGTYAVTVGAAGTAGASGGGGTGGGSGGTTSLDSLIVAEGGGGGGGGVTAYNNGLGGAHGGGGGTDGSNDGTGGAGTISSGGNALSPIFAGIGGGGGGATGDGTGVNGQNAGTVSNTAGNGAGGYTSTISGASVTYSGGGGGGSDYTGTPGTGAGAGGDGADITSGLPATGYGGGGGGTGGDNSPKSGGAGGAGVFIVRWTP